MKLFQKNPDPHFSGLADEDILVCEEMVEYKDLYFSKNTFVKTLYVGVNGVILIIPLKEDNLDKNIEEQKRCKACLEEICEGLELHLYIYPIFAGKERCFYVGSAANFENMVEVDNPYEFADQLCKFTCERTLLPSAVPGFVDEIYEFEASSEDLPIKTVLDSKTVERLLTTVSYLEGNERPQDNIRYDEDGNKLILRDSDIKIGILNTGLIGKKKWYRVSEEEPKKYVLAATMFGWAGVHKFLHGDIKNGLFYLCTCGFAGILPAIDLFSMFTGSYSYKDVTYLESSAKTYDKTVEKVYLEKAGSVVAGIGCVCVSLIIGYLITKFGYLKILESLL